LSVPQNLFSTHKHYEAQYAIAVSILEMTGATHANNANIRREGVRFCFFISAFWLAFSVLPNSSWALSISCIVDQFRKSLTEADRTRAIQLLHNHWSTRRFTSFKNLEDAKFFADQMRIRRLPAFEISSSVVQLKALNRVFSAMDKFPRSVIQRILVSERGLTIALSKITEHPEFVTRGSTKHPYDIEVFGYDKARKYEEISGVYVDRIKQALVTTESTEITILEELAHAFDYAGDPRSGVRFSARSDWEVIHTTEDWRSKYRAASAKESFAGAMLACFESAKSRSELLAENPFAFEYMSKLFPEFVLYDFETPAFVQAYGRAQSVLISKGGDSQQNAERLRSELRMRFMLGSAKGLLPPFEILKGSVNHAKKFTVRMKRSDGTTQEIKSFSFDEIVFEGGLYLRTGSNQISVIDILEMIPE